MGKERKSKHIVKTRKDKMMIGLKKRVNKIENQLNVSNDEVNLDRLFKEFQDGKHGGPSIMSIFVAYKEGGIESLERSVRKMPKPLADFLKNSIIECDKKSDSELEEK